MILIDKNVKHAYHINETFSFCGIRSSLWDSDGTGLFYLHQTSPLTMIIYSEETTRKHEIVKIKELNSSIAIVFSGVHDKSYPADLVIGKSQNVKSIDQFEAMVYPLYFPEQIQEDDEDLGIVSLTDGLDQNTFSCIGDIVEVMIKHKTKMFGDVTVRIPNYLGRLRNTQRAWAVRNSKIYIDLEGTLWPSAAYYGNRVLSFSKKKLPVDTFHNGETLDKLIDEEQTYSIADLKKTLQNKTSFDMCESIILAFGNQELANTIQQAKKSVVKKDI